MAVQFVGAGARAAGTGNVTAAVPAGMVSGDLMLLACETANEAVTTPSGWLLAPNGDAAAVGTAGGTGATRMTVFYKVAGVSEPSVTVTDAGNHIVAAIVAFRGLDVLSPFAQTNVSSSGDVSTLTLLQATAAGQLIVAFCANDVDSNTSPFPASPSIGGSIGVVDGSGSSYLLADGASNAGNGGAYGLYGGIATTAASYFAGVTVSGVSTAWQALLREPVDLDGGLPVTSDATATMSLEPLDFEHVGHVAGDSAVLLPDHLDTDAVIAMAFRDGSTTPPSVPASWDILQSAVGTGCSAVLAVKNYAVSAVDTWTQRTSNFLGATILGVGHGNGQFVAVGTSGRIGTSPDGITWTLRSSFFNAAGAQLQCVGYGNGLWVAASFQGTLGTSPDGITWTERTSSFDTSIINDVTYGGGIWVAVGGDGKLATSSDGTTWTQQTSSFSTTTIDAVTYDNGQFVAVGFNKIATSPDGINWTQRTASSFGNGVRGIAYGNGLWVAAGSAGKLATSPDGGVTWTQQTSSFNTATEINDVAYGGGLWVAVGQTGQLATSTDGFNWTQQTSGFTTSTIYNVAYDGGSRFAVVAAGAKIGTGDVAVTLPQGAGVSGQSETFPDATSTAVAIYRSVGNTPVSVGNISSANGVGTTVTIPAVAVASEGVARTVFVGHQSTDVTFPDDLPFGEDWVQRNSSFDTTRIERVAINAVGECVAVGASGKLAFSPSGANWTQQAANVSTLTIFDIAHNGSIWAFACNGGRVGRSSDGITWTVASNIGFSTNAIICIAHNGAGLWVAAGSAGLLGTSTDATSWTMRSPGFGTTSIRAVAHGNGLWVAVAEGGLLATSPNGTDWTQRTSSFDTDTIYCVAYGNDLWVAAGTSGKLATSPDGINWTQQTSSFGTNWIKSVAYGNNLWVAVALGGLIATSTDGINWTQRKSSFGGTGIYGVAYGGNGLWIAAGDLGKLATSPQRAPVPLSIRATSIDATDAIAAYDSGGLATVVEV